MAYKIAVIGNRDVVLAFKLLGFEVYPASSGEEARKILHHLAEEKVGVVLLTENLAQEIPDTISHFDTLPTPAVILIPTHQGSLGIGMAKVNDNVEKAIGQNIL
ncbi:V-type ATP synthase subunit F [Facklamia miroungae]|uniref:V/A-type H+-transporting ATPase subunit F n=1 Tax=Facklamia miroungae TaxID=120956 RepID=A0A1G7RLD6_9LACT|nr:V-type ATP synthase subunit F [Facklamia miroungae]NKZ29391.1 V-type ATP synthase subunit F [Facklamia miroungae]SDG10880.1 V/A-type H+-transporting ATPase subunit F [Facklamia miroungae]